MEEYANHDQISIQNSVEDITASPASETLSNQEQSSKKQQVNKQEVINRLRSGFKVAEICKALGVSQGYVYKIKKDVDVVKSPMVDLISEISSLATPPPQDENLKVIWAAEMKAKFLEMFYNKHGLVIDTCQAVNLAVGTYYRWYREDPEFKERVEQIKETAVDYVESQLFKQIAAHIPQSTIFFLKTRGKDRGYTERHEVTGKDGAPIEIRVIEPYVDPLADFIEAEVITQQDG